MGKMKRLDTSTCQLLKSALDKFGELEITRSLDWSCIVFEASNASDTDEDTVSITLSVTRYTEEYEERLIKLEGTEELNLEEIEEVLGHKL